MPWVFPFLPSHLPSKFLPKSGVGVGGSELLPALAKLTLYSLLSSPFLFAFLP